MENGSKALIMAGGILIAIIIIAVLTRTLGIVNSFQKAQLTEEEQAQLVKYNEQYTKYIGQYMYGTEIITIVNKHNDSYNSGITYPLNIVVNFIEGYEYEEERIDIHGVRTKRKVTVNKLNLTADDESGTYVAITSSAADSFRNRAFKCTGVGYDNSTGRINSISFQEIKWDN